MKIQSLDHRGQNEPWGARVQESRLSHPRTLEPGTDRFFLAVSVLVSAANLRAIPTRYGGITSAGRRITYYCDGPAGGGIR